MRVMTYNIFDGGRDGADLSRRARVYELLEQEQPDLVLLNECNLFELDGGTACYELEHRLSLQSVLARATTGFHLTLLAPRGSLRSARRLRAGFHHVALHVELEPSPGRRLRVLGCHLSPFSGEVRLSEAQQLAAHVAGDDTLLLGDLNALSPHDAAHARLEDWPPRYRARHLQPDGALDTRAVQALQSAGLVDLLGRVRSETFCPTRPTGLLPDRPAQRLDYIFASPDLAARCSDCRVVDGELAQRASDHLPVVADFAW